MIEQVGQDQRESARVSLNDVNANYRPESIQGR